MSALQTSMGTDPETITMLRDSATRYAADHYSFLQRRAVLDAPLGYVQQAWRDYAEFGWLALRLPEENGGIQADAAAIGALMEVVGARLLMEPLLASTDGSLALVGTAGVGKTGLVLQAAYVLAEAGEDVLFQDLEPRGEVC